MKARTEKPSQKAVVRHFPAIIGRQKYVYHYVSYTGWGSSPTIEECDTNPERDIVTIEKIEGDKFTLRGTGSDIVYEITREKFYKDCKVLVTDTRYVQEDKTYRYKHPYDTAPAYLNQSQESVDKEAQFESLHRLVPIGDWGEVLSMQVQVIVMELVFWVYTHELTEIAIVDSGELVPNY